MLHGQFDACAVTSGHNAQFQGCVDNDVKVALENNQLSGSQHARIMQSAEGGPKL